ncbi:helix-turn-helix domain-containing protein [Phreatobacter stygius]|uniref:PucR family transcriptional regulator n=1 Tax=Phreatobacter stygius TaxID=1940610 RepID=A0A4D7BAB4_9HYPH|nr:helix-turn-helix domain-containing protein [Phreatobacter stygius]QCI67633.1 PucR family transcriptional regulator [Phreatobacter stygius]
MLAPGLVKDDPRRVQRVHPPFRRKRSFSSASVCATNPAMEPSSEQRLPSSDQASLFRSLGAAASHINASGDLDTTLRHLLEAVCKDTPWAAGGIMSVDTDEGYARVVARHDPSHLGASLSDRWSLAESPSRLALAGNEPVIIRDAQKSRQFPGYRREAIEHGYRTVVVLPMQYRNLAGHRTVLSVRSRAIVAVTQAEIALLQFVVHLGEIAMNKARSLAEEQAFGERLRSALTAHGLLLDQALADGSVEAAAAKVASMLPNPLVIVDLTSRRVLTQHSPLPLEIDDITWQAMTAGEGGQQFLDLARRTFPGGRLDARDLEVSIGGRKLRVPAIVCPLNVDGERVGALILFSRTSDFNDLDHLLLDSARFGLSVQMMRSYVAHAAAARSLEDLFADLLDGKVRALHDIADRARRLGIDLDMPARLLVVSLARDDRLAPAAAAEIRRAIEPAVQRFDRLATAVARAGAIVVRYPADRGKSTDMAALTRRLIDEVRTAAGETPVVVESDICRQPADYAGAWRDCGRVRELARRFNRSGVVTARDFGPFFVLMSAVDGTEMRAFVDDLIGAAARHDKTHGTAYIQTLSTFLDHGCRSQPCADALGLHVTTLRYRLARLRDLFGLETDTPEQRFALQLALQFQKIIVPGEAHAVSEEPEET